MGVTRLGKCTWGSAEIAAVLGGIARPAADAHLQALRQALAHAGYTPPELHFAATGSLALALGLAEMKAQRPDRNVVVVPAYCCPSVPRTIRALGLTPRAAPVGENLNLDLEALGPVLDAQVLAVVGVHMYALPLDTDRLAAMARTAGAFVVDDAAHVVGISRNGKRLGTNGDLGLLSFNQSKTLTGGSPNGGGALLVTNEALAAGIARRFDALPGGKSRLRSYMWFALRFALEVTPRALSVYLGPLEGPVGSALGDELKTDERMSASAARAVVAQLRRLPEILDGRTRVVGAYLDTLRDSQTLAFPQSATPQYLSRMMVRWKQGPSSAQMREAMVRSGNAARTPYPLWTAADDATADFVRWINATHVELPGAPSLVATDVAQSVAALDRCLKAPPP